MKRHRLRRLCCLALALALAALPGCGGRESVPQTEYTRYTVQFYDTFDTVIQVIGYTETQEEFEGYADAIHNRFIELSRLYDRFYEYTGINNIRTINLNAGIQPVEVEEEILDMLEFAKEWCEKSDGRVNIAMGPVLEVWHGYMAAYAGTTVEPGPGVLPTQEELEAATAHTDLSKVIIDREAGTVYLEEPEMSLDLGAVAKGYATELVCQQLYAEGFTSFAMSSGGNVRVMDAPADGSRTAWVVGLQDPAAGMEVGASVDAVIGNDLSIVTSGDYQRYYTVDGVRYPHIIDPDTLWPADYFSSVTILCPDSGKADCLSTGIFCMPLEQGMELIESLDGVEALWCTKDGQIYKSSGFAQYETQPAPTAESTQTAQSAQ